MGEQLHVKGDLADFLTQVLKEFNHFKAKGYKVLQEIVARSGTYTLSFIHPQGEIPPLLCSNSGKQKGLPI